MEQNRIELGTKAFFTATNEVFKFSEKYVIPILNAALNKSETENALYTSYARMYLLLHALTQLNQIRDYQTVVSSTRSIFELFLDLKIIADNLIDKSVVKYFAFNEVEKFRVAEFFSEFDLKPVA